jgi:hypothetical protein
MLLISASSVARITGVSHQHPTVCVSFREEVGGALSTLKLYKFLCLGDGAFKLRNTTIYFPKLSHGSIYISLYMIPWNPEVREIIPGL